MSASLAPECNEIKDLPSNTVLEYLRGERSENTQCLALFNQYRSCLTVALKERGIDKLLEDAREDNKENDSTYLNRKSASDALLSGIYHQGSRYSVSVEAVPFMYSLIDHKQTKGRAFLLCLVTSLVIGHPTWSVPNGIDLEQWQKRIAGIESPDEHSFQLHEFRAYEAVERARRRLSVA
ncbi:hypothetical protein Cpir12675_004330 [Ceratocystis pirilliformis]|uniref:Uncharacterized protein n=1 Tax=Ceratocystis pirilliformis TaxID=259994 RepID=A0ABR3YX57_9PEZI